jgi:hypothetical protein
MSGANIYRWNASNSYKSPLSWLSQNVGWPSFATATGSTAWGQAPLRTGFGASSITNFIPSQLVPTTLRTVTLAQAGGIAVILFLIVALTIAVGYMVQVQLDSVNTATAKRSPLLQTNTVYWDGESPDLVVQPKDNVLSTTGDYVIFMDIQIQDRRRNTGQWRHIFHRGSVASSAGATESEVDPDKIAYMNPGVFLDREGSSLVIFVRTQGQDGIRTLEPVRIDNPPLLEPFRLALVMHNQIMDIYVNGKLEKTKRFPHTIVQAPSALCGMYGRVGGQFAGTVGNLLVNSSPEAVTTEYIQNKGAPPKTTQYVDPTLWVP